MDVYPSLHALGAVHAEIGKHNRHKLAYLRSPVTGPTEHINLGWKSAINSIPPYVIPVSETSLQYSNKL